MNAISNSREHKSYLQTDRRRIQEIHGDGFLSSVNDTMGKLGLYDAKWRPQPPSSYPDEPSENHVPGYSYAGPGTRLLSRLNRGDQPVNEYDRLAMEHDRRFYETRQGVARGVISDQDARSMIARADESMISGMKLVAQNDPKPSLQKTAILRAIQGKALLEKTGLLDYKKFLGKHDRVMPDLPPPSVSETTILGSGHGNNAGKKTYECCFNCSKYGLLHPSICEKIPLWKLRMIYQHDLRPRK